MKLCVTQQRLEEVPEPCFEQAEKLCVTQSGQVKLCVAQQRLGKEPEPGFEQAGKLCVTQSGQGEALCRTNGTSKALRHIISASKALCHTIGTGEALCHKRAGKKDEVVLNKQDEKPSGAVAASK